MSELEAEGRIISRDIAVEATCPKCGHENRWDMDMFNETDLWYNDEFMWCEECDATFRIVDVERA